jgi:MSHA biogenesis protein MshJ
MIPADRLRRLATAMDALTLRERLAVFAAVVFVIGGLWEAFVGQPLAEREGAAMERIAAIEDRLTMLNESVALTAQGIGGGMNEQIQRLRQLRRSVAEGEESMRIFTSDLIDPAQMRFVIEDLLRRHDGLELAAARNLEARPVLEEADGSGERRDPVLYRHGVVLEFEGGYLESLRYLEDIERLPWQLFWSRLTLETLEYPRIRIAVVVQTLSLDEEWIGV